MIRLFLQWLRVRRTRLPEPDGPVRPLEVFVDSDDEDVKAVAVDVLEAAGFDVIPMTAGDPIAKKLRDLQELLAAAIEGTRLPSPSGDVPLDVVDGPRGRAEVHGMTVPEFMDVNAEFISLVEENWPNQT